MARRDDIRIASVLGNPLSCVICSGAGFTSRELKMQTTGMTFFDLDWANESAEGVVCASCGYVHMFAGGKVVWGDAATTEPANRRPDLSGGGEHPELRDLR